ncbi:hypothetical protein H9Y04_34495 [Streptomyces sp. TRM66268-LWL]|uniref:Uncharacterized protein n=1 Tax=Streptomyces polyasparticus TaxID=2767826 RepID=A0ABR7SS86_9ACTN|nr:hypothetical protein [Streptomyces polyasparticus]MBC9717654.1 hypothetical protein [Streptomyces polyasparticus]
MGLLKVVSRSLDLREPPSNVPYCDEPHDSHAWRTVHSPDDVRLLRRDRAAAEERLRLDPEATEVTPEERQNWERIKVGRPWSDGPILGRR